MGYLSGFLDLERKIAIAFVRGSMIYLPYGRQTGKLAPHFYEGCNVDNQANVSILQYLKANGEQMDSDLAEALSIPISRLRDLVAELSIAGDVICCQVTRYIDGHKFEGTSCRLSCDLPAPARGRKPAAARKPVLEIPHE